MYPADNVLIKKKTRKTSGKTSLKENLVPGSILILLSGRFKGKRVVFLKQLDSGLLLVTGPFSINGVPTKRVNQAYTIVTSTRVNIESLDLNKYTDDYFKATTKPKLDLENLYGKGNEKVVVSASRVKDQKTLDAKLVAVIKKTSGLKQYLNASFALSKGQFPHLLKF
jgi:large subunit ribosomal protein L6e